MTDFSRRPEHEWWTYFVEDAHASVEEQYEQYGYSVTTVPQEIVASVPDFIIEHLSGSDED
jgi:hypothetical protein